MGIMKSHRIGVWDSGVGGLSIMTAVAEKVRDAAIYYCCDNKNFPYGPKSEKEVMTFLKESLDTWLNGLHLDVLIIACNTASTVALPKLRDSLPMPVIGVVPAIKPAALLSQSGCIALVATPGTVTRTYTQELIDQFAGDKIVIKLGSARLVEMAEEKLRGVPVNLEELRSILAPLFHREEPRIDHIVLGCTHFPLLSAEIRTVSPWPITLIDSSQAIGNRTWSILQNKPLSEGDTSGYIEFRFTRMDASAESLRPFLTSLGFSRIL